MGKIKFKWKISFFYKGKVVVIIMESLILLELVEFRMMVLGFSLFSYE